MQNANIPLNTTSPTRQYPWRVGVFLGIFLLSFGIGWTITKHLFTGIRAPQLATPSGLALRITPKHALWLNGHTAGLTLNDSCPIDLPTLISFKKPSWVILGDTGTDEEIFFTGKLPEKLKNYEIAFSCSITQTEQGFFLGNTTSPISFTFPLTTPDGWIWMNGNTNAIKLNNHGITLPIAAPQTKTEIPVPQQNLTSALPIQHVSSNIFSKQWEGIHNLFEKNNGIAFFSWTIQEKIEFGLVIAGKMNDEEIIALAYDLADIPTNTQKVLRKDDASYNTTTRDELTVVTKDDAQKEVQHSNGTPVAFVTQQNNFLLFSTVQTTWELSTPYWKSELSSEYLEKHTPHTLASFGKKIFTTKNTVNILDE